MSLLKNSYTRMFTKELLKLSNGVPDSHSIQYPLLDLISRDRLNRYLKRISDSSELVLEATKSAKEKRFKLDRDPYLYVACYITYLRRETLSRKCQNHMGADSETKLSQISLMIRQCSNFKAHASAQTLMKACDCLRLPLGTSLNLI